MSRCFPFPPPGYEKKARTIDPDLLRKEKHQEKKHKREKRDKEKKEGKEKREKEDKEKKDKKEKHRDKKKDRNKDENNFLSGTNRHSGQSDGSNGENFTAKSRDTAKDKSIALDDRRIAGKPPAHNGVELSQNNHQATETKDLVYVQECHSWTTNEERRASNQMLEKHAGEGRRKIEGIVPLAGKNMAALVHGTKRNQDKKKANDGNEDMKIWTRPSGNALAQNSAGMAQNRAEGMAKPMENIDLRVDKKEKDREKEADHKEEDKRRDKDRDKTSKKDKDREKEKKNDKEKKVKQSEHRQIEQLRTNDNSTSDIEQSRVGIPPGVQNNRLHPNESDYENIRKRKELVPNVVVHEVDVRPNKMARTLASSCPLTENGRSLEPCQTPIIFDSVVQRAPGSIKANSKEPKRNGTIDAHLFRRSSQATAHADQNAETSRNPPHPDTKYLSQVLSVPKMDEWSGFDDQEWLGGSGHSKWRNPKLETRDVSEAPAPQVWAEALKIESADVIALPYVNPY
ncbi:hypothetical protein Nepgr_009885 [Nepenthes gracilis]|uniref:Myb-like protein X n=1 Tax=Nepenthes gracilis TaxID=150966 RepID=A0AAD3SB96_NEPGR|nr:hypothetical protein Nepgr_009885 [Nepenthes gracilis]